MLVLGTKRKKSVSRCKWTWWAFSALQASLDYVRLYLGTRGCGKQVYSVFICLFSLSSSAAFGISATIFKGKIVPNYIIESSKYLRFFAICYCAHVLTGWAVHTSLFILFSSLKKRGLGIPSLKGLSTIRKTWLLSSKNTVSYLSAGCECYCSLAPLTFRSLSCNTTYDL